MALKCFGEKLKTVGQMLTPIVPGVVTSKFLISVRDACGVKFAMELAIGGNERVIDAAIEAERRESGGIGFETSESLKGMVLV